MQVDLLRSILGIVLCVNLSGCLLFAEEDFGDLSRHISETPVGDASKTISLFIDRINTSNMDEIVKSARGLSDKEFWIVRHVEQESRRRWSEIGKRQQIADQMVALRFSGKLNNVIWDRRHQRTNLLSFLGSQNMMLRRFLSSNDEYEVTEDAVSTSWKWLSQEDLENLSVEYKTNLVNLLDATLGVTNQRPLSIKNTSAEQLNKWRKRIESEEELQWLVDEANVYMNNLRPFVITNKDAEIMVNDMLCECGTSALIVGMISENGKLLQMFYERIKRKTVTPGPGKQRTKSELSIETNEMTVGEDKKTR